MYKKITLFIISILICSVAYAESYKIMHKGIMRDDEDNYINDNIRYIQRQSDLALIPMTKENPDYLKYLDDVRNEAEISDFDYEAEDLRQAQAKEAPKELTLDERVKAIEEKLKNEPTKEIER